MITILSPAKNMKIREDGTRPQSMPVCLSEARCIWEELRTYLPPDFQALMNISEKLAEDSFDRIQAMKWDCNGTSAVETYEGIQYKYMDPGSFSDEAKVFAQKHVRILSGLYGILRPYDSIYEYRLEMLTRLSVGACKNLYEFWGDRLYGELIADLMEDLGKKSPVILNLASEEYGKIIKRHRKDPIQIVTCSFRTYSKGRHRVLATAAKMARGSMVRYLAMNQIDSIEGVKKFCWGDYHYEETLSSPQELVFLQG